MSSSSSSATDTSTLLTLLLVLATAVEASAAGFACTRPPPRNTCHALVDYVPINATTFSAIQSLFGVKKLDDLLGANGIPIPSSAAAARNATVKAKERVKVPFHCACANGTGISAGGPIYAVRPNDTLDGIARQVFSGLVKFQDIAAASGVPNPDLIEAGQRLTIPIPCSCDAVDGVDVVHYGHVVAQGSSVEAIAEAYGTNNVTLLRLNNMTDAKDLMADQLLDVPLKACSSSVRNTSLDNPLLVPNGTYVLTAHNCIKCQCDTTKNWTLQCEPSHLNSTLWSSCPLTSCNNLTIGDMTGNLGTCGQTCAYAGYNNQTIFSALVEQPTCPANGASKMGMQAWNWNFLFFSFHLALLTLALS